MLKRDYLPILIVEHTRWIHWVEALTSPQRPLWMDTGFDRGEEIALVSRTASQEFMDRQVEDMNPRHIKLGRRDFPGHTTTAWVGWIQGNMNIAK